jgi:hypothetical protein
VKYLYGDASESPIEVNYIELLRDVLDFGAAVMLAQDGINRERKLGAERSATAERERRELRSVLETMERTLASCRQTATAEITRRNIDAMRATVTAESKRAETAVEANLGAELAKMQDAIGREQANNVKRLETLLLKHDLPECSLWVSARLNDKFNGADKANRYVAELIGKAASEVAFVIDLDIPAGHLLSDVVKVERINPALTVKLPEESGWVRKSVKWRAHKLGKEHLYAVARSTKRTTIKLRTNLAEPDTGYDIIYGSGRRVAIARQQKGQKGEAIEPAQEDKNDLLAFHDELEAALGALKHSRRTLRGAQLDGTPLAEHADATVLVRRLVTQLAPVVQEIARRSLGKGELVLKRVLADDRREEIFASKADLRAKLEPLPLELRRVFAPLGLDEEGAGAAPAREAPQAAEAIAVIPQSVTAERAREATEPVYLLETPASSPPPAMPAHPSPPMPSAPPPMPSTPPAMPSTPPAMRPGLALASMPAGPLASMPAGPLASMPAGPQAHPSAPPAPPARDSIVSDSAIELVEEATAVEEPRAAAAERTPPSGSLPAPTPPPARPRKRAPRAAPPEPPPSRPRPALPKPSVPPPRPPPVRPADAGPLAPDRIEGRYEIQAGDSVDVALDELLNNPKQ